jgi:thiol-disulfide isomerase/thioredoxin
MQNPMVWAVVVGVIAVGAYFFIASNNVPSGGTGNEGAMMEDKGENGAMEQDAMMEGGKSETGMMKDEAMMEKDTMMDKGSYESYAPEKLALAEKGKVVLFFHADWCPICRGLESEVKANMSAIPAGVHILKVNYDTATTLKQKYGVTYQHTFVQVDANGMQLAKWGDATTLAQVVARVK